jgi:signal transduction histidine kinase
MRTRVRWLSRVRPALAEASLRTRVMAAAAFLVILTSLVTGVLGATLLRSYLTDRSDSQLRSFAQVVGHTLQRPRSPAPGSGGPGGQQPAPQQQSAPKQQSLPTQFLVEVASAEGKIHLAGGPVHDSDGPRLTAAQLHDLDTPFTAPAPDGSGGSWRVLVEPLSGGEHLITAYSLGDLGSTVTRLEVADTLAGAVAVALLAGIGLPLVRASLMPLARIEATAAAIARGDLSRRIDHPSARTEVGRLSGALDTMLATIEAAYRARAEGEARALHSEDQMRQFVADASHELRTPLTSVRGLAEYGLQQGTEASQAELLRLMTLIDREASRMGRLVEDLLLLAKLDAGRSLNRQPVDLASIAAEAVSAARMVHPGRRIALRAPEPVVISADDERVRQVIDNLIGNAVTHTPDDSPVTVTVACDAGAGQGEVTVSDEGPGMAPEQAAHVFERFYRTDDSRARSSGGAGLGLAIAASLTAAHGGEITVDTAPGQGAAFRVRLPVAARDFSADRRNAPSSSDLQQQSRNPAEDRNEIASPASLTASVGPREARPRAAGEVRVYRPIVLGVAAIAAVMTVAGCSSSSNSSSGNSSSSGSSQASSFQECLKKHGVTLPSGFGGGAPGGGQAGSGSGGGQPPSGSTASPRPRPTGAANSTFQKAIQACGGPQGGGFGGGGSGGGPGGGSGSGSAG